jgi:hypothetical protein
MSRHPAYPRFKCFSLQLAQEPTPLQRAMDKLRAKLGDNEYYLWASSLGESIGNRQVYREAIERKLDELERPLPFDRLSDYVPTENEESNV